MAGLTIVEKRWGWAVGGSTAAGTLATTATVLTSGPTRIKSILLCGEASADTVTVADAAGNNLISWAAPVTLAENFDMFNVVSNGITVTGSTSMVICNIFIE